MSGKIKTRQALAPPAAARSHSIRVTIMTGFVGLLLLTAGPIIWYMHFRNTTALLELADELMVHCSKVITEETINYLEPASVMAEMSAHLAENESFSLLGNPAFENYAIAVLKAYPQLAMFNMADFHGNFLMPKKMSDGTIATKVINREANPPTVTWKYRNSKGEVVRRETSTEVKYDPRIRPWYKGALEGGGTTYWTDMYILFTDQVPGITTAHPFVDKQGRTLGVFSIDIQLGTMSKFLQSLKIGNNGIAFVFNEKGELVAYPDLSCLVTKEDGKLKPVLVHQLEEAKLTNCLEQYQLTKESRFNFAADGETYIGSVMDFPDAFGKNWKIGLVVPQNDFIGTLSATSRNTLLIAMGILLLAVLVAHRLSRAISSPVMELAKDALKIQDLQFLSETTNTSSISEIRELQDALASMKTGLSAFGKYVPAALVKQLVQTGEAAHIGGHREELTIFFSDIAGFTPICEELSPEELMTHLSEYFEHIARVVGTHGGTVDKFIGDAVMAFWGAPSPEPDHAYRACLAALHCQQAVGEMNARWQTEGKTPFPTRIGIHTGNVVVGNVGSDERMNYSVLGDPVNVASRLEGANKVYGTSIIVGESTYQALADRLVFRPLDRVAVIGRKQTFMIYELMGKTIDELPAGATELQEGFTAGLEAYFRRDWKQAGEVFSNLSTAFPDDMPSALFVKRCRLLLENPPGEDWDGVTHIQIK